MSYARNNTIGGTAAGAGNVIAANGQDGIKLEGIFATGNVVAGNFIGTDPSGTRCAGQRRQRGMGAGLEQRDRWHRRGAGNTIAFNTGAGVAVSNGSTTTAGVSILSNAISSNGGLGIKLDSNTNDNQTAPVLTSAVSFSGGTLVQGTLTSTPNSTFTIQFFSNVAPDPSGHGEGQDYQGSATVLTDANGNASIAVTLPNAIPAGQFLSATATSVSKGDTSAFAGDIVITDPAGPAAITSASHREHDGRHRLLDHHLGEREHDHGFDHAPAATRDGADHHRASLAIDHQHHRLDSVDHPGGRSGPGRPGPRRGPMEGASAQGTQAELTSEPSGRPAVFVGWQRSPGEPGTH